MKPFVLFVLLFCHTFANAQTNTGAVPPQIPGAQNTTSWDAPLKQHNLLLQRAVNAPAAPPNAAARTTLGAGPVFDTAQWNHRVDSTWGAGLSSIAQLNILNKWWGHIDSLYPCFVHLPAYNWDSIVNSLRAHITAGVSEGRFAGLINYLLSLVNDGHANFYDYLVNYPASLYQGLPLFRGESGKLGACVTTLDDTVALVYDAFPGQPYGLQPGDVILGYNGIPWTKLVKTILDYRLPNSVYKGSTDAATYHRYIQAAGENWYLFDTINIKKCSGAIVNLPTSLMTGVLYQDFCTEQMWVPGVNRPTYYGYYNLDSNVVAGVVKGTHIGYVYMYDCVDTTHKLYKAVKRLIEDSLVTGLILDIRTNFGGGFNSYWDAFQYLSPAGASWVGYGQRSDPTNRLAMYIDGPTSWYDIYDTDPAFFNHPIAILCGPNAVSAGDFFPVMFKHNPRVKLFGKSTAGAFGNLVHVNTGNTNYIGTMQETNFFQASAPTYYISHTDFPVDFPVWFSRDSVCAGKDNVVTTAVQWIQGFESVPDLAQATTISVFPNPASDRVIVEATNVAPGIAIVTIADIAGRVLIQKERQSQGGNISMPLDTRSLSAGMYFVTLKVGTSQYTAKFVKRF